MRRGTTRIDTSAAKHVETDKSYSKAPIVEAVLDIQVVPPQNFKHEHLLKCQQRVKKDYPEAKPDRNLVGEFSVAGEVASASGSIEQVGYRFFSPDRRQLFQAKASGFTFNRLAPYTGWDAFFAEAKRLWEEYRRVVGHTEYKRLALRYINHIEFPTPLIDMEDYFNTYLKITQNLPQLVQGFYIQFNLLLPDAYCVASITQASASSSPPGTSAILLDIDVHRTEEISSEGELWSVFETMRAWKSKIFEDCITDKTRELIR